MEKINKSLRLSLGMLLLAAAGGQAVAQPEVTGLQCEGLVNPLGIDNVSPHFSWRQSPGTASSHQVAYEIEVGSDSLHLARGRADRWKSGRIASADQVMVAYRGKALHAKDLCFWRVRVWDRKGRASSWSKIGKFSIGLLRPDDIAGSYIGMDARHGELHAPLLRKDFVLDKVSTTLLHVNSLGYHEVYVNGRKVGSSVLAPAVSQLDKRSHILTYDITPYLHKGSNMLIVWAGQGWYKTTTFKAQYPGPLVRAQADALADGQWKTLIATDNSWKASPGGYNDTGTWQALMFGGERVDGRIVPTDMGRSGMDARKWSPVVTVDVKGMEATPQMCEPNIICSRLRPIAVSPLSDGSWLIDMGRVITGWFSLRMNGLAQGHEVKMEYSDWLEPDGSFKCQGESDSYIAAGRGTEFFRNRFNHHAFRYVRVIGLKNCPSASEVEALQISGGYTDDASFACSDRDLNAIHDMVKRTLRCLNFSGYMVDCPHLERTGYGGDGNSSTMTAQTIFGLAPVYYNWLQAWGDVIAGNGSLPYVAPAGGGGGGPWWCAFIVKAPWSSYLNYGDARTMSLLYEKMKLWMQYVEKNSPDGLLLGWEDTPNRMWFFGDWLAPNGVDVGGESVKLSANCVVSDCLGTLARIAKALGKDDEAKTFADRKRKLNGLIHQTFYHPADSTYGLGTALDMAYPQLTGVVPANLRQAVDEKLVNLMLGKYKAHIASGLMGVPIFTEWITRFGHSHLMTTILKQPNYPGYMDMINHGATTTWEAWNGDRSHVHNCYNGIGTWFYQAIAGIVPDEPAYKHFTINPQTANSLSWAKASKQTPYGTIAVDWRKSGNGKIELNVEVPLGSTATLPRSLAKKAEIDGQQQSITPNGFTLEAGKHRIVY